MTRAAVSSLCSAFFVIALWLLLPNANLHAQPKPEAVKHARKGFQFEQETPPKLQQALYEYNQAIALDPNYPYPLVRIAQMYQGLRNYPVAIQYYGRAIKIDSSFDVYEYFNLGLSYRVIQKFDSAVINFKEFLKRIEPISQQDSENMKDADFWIRFNLKSLEVRARPKNTTEPVPIFGNVNSPYDDFAPTVTADGQTLYFTSRRPSTNKYKIIETNDYGDDIFVTHRDTSGKWSNPTAIPPPVNSIDDEGAASISADGQTIYFSECRRPDGYGDCDLYLSELYGDQWSPPQNMGGVINSPRWDAEPSVTADGKTMYFSSKRMGSIEGSEDIWVTYKNTDGSWIKPQNLGEPINTRFSERSPFIAADGKTLYFSSNGHPGIGNHDLFVSRKLDDGTWSEPQDLGTPINSDGDDEFLTIPARGDKIYFSSQRNNPKGNLDIFETALPKEFRPGPITVVAGTVYDKETNRPLGATIEVNDLKTDQLVAVYRSNRITGKFYITLGTGKSYGITATAPNYAFYSEHYTVPDTISYKELTHDLPLVRIAGIDTGAIAQNNNRNNNPNPNGNNNNGVDSLKNHPGGKPPEDASNVIPLNNLFFDFNKATLRPESLPELNHLAQLLKDHPTIRIEISGHTDSVGTPAINQALSQGRAQSVKNYLVSKSIASSRIVAKGYGSSRPIDSNATEEGRQRNRRTEFRILKK